MKNKRILLLLMIVAIMATSCMTKLDLIRTDITKDEFKKMYGWNTIFRVKRISEYDIYTITKTMHNSLLRDFRLDRKTRKERMDKLKAELEYADNQYFGLIMISVINYNSQEIDFKFELADSENNVISGKNYFMPITVVSNSGITYYYYYIFKSDRPVDNYTKDLSFKVIFPDGRNQIYLVPVSES